MKNPWKGLACYQESDAETYKFCGRDHAISDLSTLIQENLFVTLYGRTGIGKTSLLRAGVFPILRKSGFMPIVFRFNDEEISDQDLTDRIISKIESSVPRIEVTCDSYPDINPIDRLWAFFATRIFFDERGEEIFPLLVFDQFEEIFFKGSTLQHARMLMRQMHSLIDDNKSYPPGFHDETNFRIVISVREDELYRLEDCIDSLQLTELKQNRYRLKQLTDKDAADIICLPGAECLPRRITDRRKIVDRILSIVKNGREDNLSTLMLSLVCSQIYQKSTNGKISEATLNSLSGNVLGDFYREVASTVEDSAQINYIEDNLVDENGRRNSVNIEVMDKNCPAWARMSDGSNRIFQVSDGRVELIHDMLALTIFENRELRHQEEKNRRLEEEKARIEKEKESEAQRNAQYQKMLHQMQVNQARAVAEKASALLHEGDPYTASLITLEVLPEDMQVPSRPWTIEAENALRSASRMDPIILRDQDDHVITLACSEDGMHLASGSRKKICIWNLANGTHLEISLDQEREDLKFFFFDKGQILYAVFDDNKAGIFDIATGNSLAQPMQMLSEEVECFMLSPDREKFLLVNKGNILQVVAAESDQVLGSLKLDEGEKVIAMALSDDNRLVRAVLSSNRIMIWEVTTQKPIMRQLRNDIPPVNAAAFSHDGKQIALACNDNSIWVVNSRNGASANHFESQHIDRMSSVTFSHDSKMVFTGSFDHTIRVHSLSGKKSQATLMRHSSGKANFAIFTADGHRVISVGEDQKLYLWNVFTGKPEGKPILAHDARICCLALSPDGKTLATGSADNTVKLWNVNGMSQIGNPLRGHSNLVKSVAFSPDGQLLASASYDHTVRIWDVKSQKMTCQLLGHRDCVSSVAFSPDGLKIVSSSKDKTIILWDAMTGARLGSPMLGHTNSVNCVAFSPDGSRIVSASSDNTLRFWEAATCEPIGNPVVGHADSVYHLAFSPDGRYIASASADGSVRLWDASSGLPLTEILTGYEDVVNSVAFNAKGDRIVTASFDGTVGLWPFSSCQALIDSTRERLCGRELTPEERHKYYLDS